MAPATQSRHKLDLNAEEFRERKFTATIERAAVIDEAERTVEFSFASEMPVDRYFGREILDVSAEACDLSRLNDGGACLVNHDWDKQVGVVVRAWIDATTKKARCLVKFSRGEDGQEIFDDIKDGIRRLVSVGYVVRKMVLQSVDGEMETHRVTDWQPYEVSIVSVPADPSVGIGRSAATEEKTVRKSQPSLLMSQTPAAPAAPIEGAAPAVAVTHDNASERNRVKELFGAARALAERHPQHAEAIRNAATKCAETGDDVATFNRTILNDVLGTKRDFAPVTQAPDAAVVGLKKRDLERYSILRAIRAQVENKPLDGLERECSDEIARKLERQPKGFFLPEEVHAHRRSVRTLQATVAADGGYTVGTEILAGELETLLRNQTRVVGLGARVIGGLVGDVTIPRQLTGATAYWVSESGSITQSSATFGQIVGRPRRIGTSVPYTKQFLAQTSLDAESFVVRDSDEAIAVELDRVAIRGAGASEPLGILNLASGDRSTSVTFGAAPTWAKYLEFFSNVASNNAILGSPAYLTTPASAVKAMATPKFSNTATPIWDADMVGLFRAQWSNQFPSSGTLNQVIFGDFSQVLFLEWAGRDVVVDPYSGKKEGTVEVTIQRLIDMVIRRGKSFAISSDSGAQ